MSLSLTDDSGSGNEGATGDEKYILVSSVRQLKAEEKDRHNEARSGKINSDWKLIKKQFYWPRVQIHPHSANYLKCFL